VLVKAKVTSLIHFTNYYSVSQDKTTTCSVLEQDTADAMMLLIPSTKERVTSVSLVATVKGYDL